MLESVVVNLRSVRCLFDDDYMCGYTTNHVGDLKWKRATADLLTYYTGESIYSNVSAYGKPRYYPGDPGMKKCHQLDWPTKKIKSSTFDTPQVFDFLKVDSDAALLPS